VVLVAGAPGGFVQHYPLPEPELAGLDFCVGNPELTGVGLGPQLIWAYLRAIVLPGWPRLRTVVASPEAGNSRSILVLTKAGFRPAGEPGGGQLRGRPELRCVLDRGHMLGQAS
jgi:RimJ/RimL family protein N-acetyltransferase